MEKVDKTQTIVTSNFSEAKARLYRKPREKDDMNFNDVFCSHNRWYCGIQPNVLSEDKIETKQSRESFGRKYFVIVNFTLDEETFFGNELVNRAFQVAYYDGTEKRVFVVLRGGVKAPLFWEWFHDKFGKPGFKVYDWKEEKKSLDTLLSLGFTKYRSRISDAKLTDQEVTDYKNFTFVEHHHQLDRERYDYHDRLKPGIKRAASRTKKNPSYQMETEESEESSPSVEKPQPKRKQTTKASSNKKIKQNQSKQKTKGNKRTKLDSASSSDSDSSSSDDDSSDHDERKTQNSTSDVDAENTDNENTNNNNNTNEESNSKKKKVKETVPSRKISRKKTVKQDSGSDMDSDSDVEKKVQKNRKAQQKNRKTRSKTNQHNYELMDAGISKKKLFSLQGIPIKIRQKKYVRPVDDAKNEDLLASCFTLFTLDSEGKFSEKIIMERLASLEMEPLFKGRLQAYVTQHFNELVAIVSPPDLKNLVLINNAEGDIIWESNADSFFNRQMNKRKEDSTYVKEEPQSDPSYGTFKTSVRQDTALNGQHDYARDSFNLYNGVKIEAQSLTSDPFPQTMLDSALANLPDMTDLNFTNSQENLMDSLNHVVDPKLIANAIRQRNQQEEEEHPPLAHVQESEDKATPVNSQPTQIETMTETKLENESAEAEPVSVAVPVQTPTVSGSKKKGSRRKEPKSTQSSQQSASLQTPTVVPSQELSFDLRAIGKEEGIKLKMPADSTVALLFLQVKEVSGTSEEFEINYNTTWIKRTTVADLGKKLSEIFASEKPGRDIKLFMGPNPNQSSRKE